LSGFGSSCSQPLFAYLPSKIVGSGRKTISMPEPVEPAGSVEGVGSVGAAAAVAAFGPADPAPADPGPADPGPVDAMNPSCSACRHIASTDANAPPFA